MRFSDRVVVVTGGANGIGRATVERFASEGARVAVLDAEGAAARAVVAGLERPELALVVECDILDRSSVDAAVAVVEAELGGIDALVSVAGGDREVADPLDEEHWDWDLDLNLRGPVRLVRSCLPALRRSRGRVVLVGSVNGLVAFGGPAYSSAKAGLSSFAKNLAVILGADGITVNVVAPGTVRTRVWDGRDTSAMTQFSPLGRIGEPADIAAAIAFLASDDASWITGVTLPVDGGAIAGPLTTLVKQERDGEATP
jgi:NAD(P)-dependent dehydrogenase (short-subunit alcohol dehydrogenase family)